MEQVKEVKTGFGTSSHDNTIKLHGDMIKEIEYVENSLVITDGQPSSPPPKIATPSGQDPNWSVTMKCGRKGSSGVANKFNSECGSKYHEYAPDHGSGGTPKELNFYFKVVLTVEINNQLYKVRDVRLAQGHYSTTNNWWIGSSNVFNDNKKVLIVADSNGTVVGLLSMSGNHDSFSFEFL